jgi:Cu+-exporting ATPase
METQTNTPQTDPVCGMQVNPSEAAASSEHAGQRYYFCCQACKTKFDNNPEEYVRK